MLRLRLLLGASCSFCLRIWDVDFFNDVVVWLGWIVAADAVSSYFSHYCALNIAEIPAVVRPLATVPAVAKAPVTPVCVK